LSSIVSGLPPVHVMHEEVATPFDQKGTVMRSVLERARSDELILLDGVKTLDATGWTLVVPDPEEPVTHVFAEGDSESASHERAQRAVEEIADILAGA
jgi:mannose-1-phosphate guanylyltransferase/phosphomannomutase